MGQAPARSNTERGIPPLAFAYATFGIMWGSIAVVLVDFLATHGLSAGRVGFYFTLTSITGILVMMLLAPRMEHLPRNLTIPLALGLEGIGAIMFGTVSGSILPLAFVMVGVGTGLIDVLINTVAYEREQHSERAVLQWVHASYGIGSGLGALGAGIAMTNGASIGVVMSATGVLLLVAAAVCFVSRVLRSTGPRERSETKVSLSAFRRRPYLLVPALIVASSFFIEGSMDVWAGAYVQATLGGSYMMTGLSVAAFGFALAAGRGTAARLFGLGYRRTIILSGVASVIAATVALMAPSPLVAGLAFLVLGYVLAGASPAAFGSVEAGASSGADIAAVTTVGYSGFIIGPPIMGWLADVTGDYRVTMLVIALATVGVAIGGLLTRRTRVSAKVGP